MQAQNLLTVIIIPMHQDNFCYYVYSQNIDSGIFIDPAEMDKVEQFQKDFGLKGEVTDVFTTHKHWDHSGANEALR